MRTLPTVFRYGAALVIAACALAIRLALQPVLGQHVPYTILYFGVTLTSFLLGFGPSVATVAACDFLLEFHLLPARFSLAAAVDINRATLLLFNIESLAICLIIASLQSTRRKLEQAIADADKQRDRAEMLRQEAERANSAKDEFLGMISHELRNPITALALMPALLRSGIESAEQNEKIARIIERSTAALGRMVEDLVDSTRIVSGKFRLSVTSLDLVKVVDAAVDMMRGPAEAEGLELVKSVGPAALSIEGDEDRLREALCNLIGNAIKFTPRGRITVGLEAHDGDSEISVADTGNGIEPEMLPRVFDRFVQARETFSRKGGLGLGLFIVKHVVELHGGTIAAHSAGKGRGARFVIILPDARSGAEPWKWQGAPGETAQ